MAATIMGLVALFGSWWALGMTIGIWSVDGGGAGLQTTREIPLALAFETFVLIFPFGVRCLCVRFAKTVLWKDQASSTKTFQE